MFSSFGPKINEIFSKFKFKRFPISQQKNVKIQTLFGKETKTIWKIILLVYMKIRANIKTFKRN